MTIKRRLFMSNIRMVVISMMAFGLIGHIIMNLIFGLRRFDREAIEYSFESISQNKGMLLWFLSTGFFLIIVSIINSFFTHRMTKQIIKPLEPLGEGVRQIQDHNLAYRIDYQNNDEFRPICNAFNEMAAKLENSTIQRKKDEANRRELIAGLSHDLRTPLTSIKGCIEGIETGVASTPEMQKNYLGIIKTKTADIEHIIEQLFLFSKLDMDEFPLTMRRTDIILAVTDMIDDSLSEYASRGLTIKFTKKPKNIYVLADVLMLRNVIINILENSVKYKTKKQGQMNISAAVENNSVLLCLTDDGPGVKPEMLPKLLDIFFRADPSRSKQGSGLGLAISAKTIQRMGGTIYAELPDIGGLSIIIKLPLLLGEAA